MGKTLLVDGAKYKMLYRMGEVNDFEPTIIGHIKDIFGEGCEYFPKRKLATLANNRRIPDGFVVDFENKKWYVVEIKLLCDDAIRRIRDQIDDYRTAAQNPEVRMQIYKAIKRIKDCDFLADLITDTEPQFIIVIDKLDGVMGEQFKEKVNKPNERARIIEFNVFIWDKNTESKYAFLYEPLKIEAASTGSAGMATRKHLPYVRSQGQVTTQRAYIKPILGALIDEGGEASLKKSIYSAVENRMKNTLVGKDYENLHTGEIRWVNTIRQAKRQMLEIGLLDKKSSRGVWKVTEKGRRYYEECEPL